MYLFGKVLQNFKAILNINDKNHPRASGFCVSLHELEGKKFPPFQEGDNTEIMKARGRENLLLKD